MILAMSRPSHHKDMDKFNYGSIKGEVIVMVGVIA